MPEKPLLDVFSSCSFKSCVLSQGFLSNSLFCGLFFQMMPMKGKGKVSKQTNKLESVVSGAFSTGLLAAEPFFAYRVLMISEQRVSKQTKKWGVCLFIAFIEKRSLGWPGSIILCNARSIVCPIPVLIVCLWHL